MTTITGKMKILVVEDETHTTSDLETRLTGLGYANRVQVVTSEKALALIEQHPPDLVMMDIVLQGGMDGPGMERAIWDKWKIPVVFLISSSDSHRLEPSRLTYPFGYIFMPFRDCEIKIALEMALNVAKVDAERRNAEEALRHEKKMLARTERIANMGSWELDIATGKVAWSEELFRIFQMDSFHGAPSWAEHSNLVHPEDFGRLKEGADKAITDGTPYELEMPIIRKDGETRFCVVRGFPEKDSKGQVQRLFGSFQDITERKLAEQALKDSEEKYYAFFKQAADAIILFDPESNELVEYNEKLYQNLGYSREELACIKISDFEVLESSAEVDRHTNKILEKGSDIFETKHRTKRGEIRDTLVSSRVLAIGGKNYIQSIFRDITEIKHAEKALHDSEKRYRSIIEASPLGIGIANTEAGIVDANQALALMLGYSIKELLNLNFRDITHPDDLKLESELIKSLMNSEEKSFSLEKRYRHKNGNYFWVNLTVAKMLDFVSNEIFIFGFVEDISNRKQMESEREKLIKELQEALAEIKELRGFLPICSNCKKIRDDDGYWQQVEKYIMDRTDAKFSHSLCPDCIKELYPDICDSRFEKM